MRCGWNATKRVINYKHRRLIGKRVETSCSILQRFGLGGSVATIEG